MKMTFILFLIFLSIPAFAIDVEFVGPCEDKPFLVKKIRSTTARTVGELTIDVLEKTGTPYLGNSRGLNQIYHSPIGMDALEVISDNEMMAYGWCFEIDGKITETLADETNLDGIKRIKWFFGYAHYLNGDWVGQCLFSHLRKSKFICH